MKERLFDDILIFLTLILSQVFFLASVLTDGTGIGLLFIGTIWLISYFVGTWERKKYLKYKKEE